MSQTNDRQPALQYMSSPLENEGLFDEAIDSAIGVRYKTNEMKEPRRNWKTFRSRPPPEPRRCDPSSLKPDERPKPEAHAKKNRHESGDQIGHVCH